MEDYLRTDALDVGYGKQVLIKNINLQLKQGEIMVLIGPNGSGKSTILKSITKYLRPMGGEVWLDARKLEEFHPHAFAKSTAIVFTERLKTEWMTCEDVVSTGRYPYTGHFGILTKEDRQKVKEAMELVQVLDLAQRDFTCISDGQRQRILLARAICQEPKLIVLDEPTSFLDVRYQLELLEILHYLAKEKKMAVILSLHELDMAQKIADYVVCVKGDSIFRAGTPEEIFRSEIIEELYDLDNGSYNPYFGSLELGKVRGKAKVFVIAGAGTGVTCYRRLQKEKIPFATGVLHKNDVDYQVAMPLAQCVIAEEAFEEIGEGAMQQAIAVMRECEEVYQCIEHFGGGNRRNEELVRIAQEWGKLRRKF